MQQVPNIYQLRRKVNSLSLFSFTSLIMKISLFLGLTISIVSFAGSWLSYQWELSASPQSITEIPSSQSTKILAGDGSLMYEMYDKENREEIYVMEQEGQPEPTSNYIPLKMQYAMLALEDENFYYNDNGLPVSNIIGATAECFTTLGSSCRGASGIYQQLIKNKTNNDGKSLDRKVQELISAYRLGSSPLANHQEVLRLYLNTVGFGRNAHGVQKAAQTYFNKNIKDVTIAEACLLASFPQIPPNYNTQLNNPESTMYKYYKNRKETCLSYLSKKIIKPSDIVEQRKDQAPYITEEQSNQYKTEPITIVDANAVKKYPHFVDFVIQEVAYKRLTAKGYNIYDRLDESNNESEDETVDIGGTTYTKREARELEITREKIKYGAIIYNLTEKELRRGGYTIKTTLLPDIQAKLESHLKDVAYGISLSNNSAGAILDGKTGSIVAMVGSSDYFDPEIAGSNNQIGKYSPYDLGQTASHIVGSTMKIYDYALALDKGANPQMYINNQPLIFGDRTTPLNNYPGVSGDTRTLSKSLAYSLNVAAVKAAYIGANGLNTNYKSAEQGRLTRQELAAFVRKIGGSFIRTEDLMKTETLASVMAIGSEDMTLLSHLTGLNTIAQGGKLRTATPFESIKYRTSEGIERDIYTERMSDLSNTPYPYSDKAMDAGVANQVSSILRLGSPESIISSTEIVPDWDIASKTGTAVRGKNEGDVAELSNIAWSPKYSALIWTGKTDTSGAGWKPLRSTADAKSVLALPVMLPLMRDLHTGLPGERFGSDGLQSYQGRLLTEKQIKLLPLANKTF